MFPKNIAVAAILVGLSLPASAQDVPKGNAMDGSDAFSDQCAICHNTDPGDPSGAGPNIAGIVGRKAGGAPDFPYSDAMKNSGITWDGPTLFKYIQAPGKTVPGTKMALGFAGVPDPGTAADIVAYLQSLPPGAPTGAAPAGGAAAPAGAAPPPASAATPPAASATPPIAPATPSPQ